MPAMHRNDVIREPTDDLKRVCGARPNGADEVPA